MLLHRRDVDRGIGRAHSRACSPPTALDSDHSARGQAEGRPGEAGACSKRGTGTIGPLQHEPLLIEAPQGA